MAKYKAEPHYAVGADIQFDYFGNYETEDAKEIKQLDELAPKWIKRVDEPKQEKVETSKRRNLRSRSRSRRRRQRSRKPPTNKRRETV